MNQPTGAELVAGLRRVGIADVDNSRLARILYASDASLYRVPPLAVVRPRDVDEVLAAVAVCRALVVPVTSRGAGTSIAGNAVGPGLVIDFSKYLDRMCDIDVEQRLATVDPGVVQASLQRAAAPHGLRFGPDPSTHNRATLGGMIGNNACGSRALGYGRTSDNVVALDVLTGSGQRISFAAGDPETSIHSALESLVAGELATIRAEFGRFDRQISGYGLEHLLPENGFDVARALVGSEGTLAVVLGATVRLVTAPRCTVLVVLGYPDIAAAADAVPTVLPHAPTACEGIDARIVDVVRSRRGGTAVPPLPGGGGWLLVELIGDNESEVADKAERLVVACAAYDSMIVTDPAHCAALWRIREDGAGLSARTADGRPAYSGWEDAAVPPAVLGNYLRDFERLLVAHRLTGLPYGHFGDGCLHIRIDFPLDTDEGPAVLRTFQTEAAELVARYGGSLSGEHGDGRSRSELLPKMYSPEAIALFAKVKHIFDPESLLNPGVLVDPAPLDADLRPRSDKDFRERLAFGYPGDRGDLAVAVHRCTGVGKCRADTTGSGGVMCPSFQATGDEKDSTRGRARVLQELVSAPRNAGIWSSPEITEVLDLCLSCKGCAADCPTGVDLATYKAEVLYQRYRGKIRPRSHYTLGRLPTWSRLAARAPRLVNATLRSPTLGKFAKWGAGVDTRRGLPEFASATFRAEFAMASGPAIDSKSSVLIFVDPFTDHFAPQVGMAAVRVLENAGYRVQLTGPRAGCALTWITTGQLDRAREILRRTVEELLPAANAAIPIVGLEPSSTAVLRSEVVELLGTTEARTVAASVRTLAELLLATPGWTPPELAGMSVVAQPHCHHHAVMGWEADAQVLAIAGVDVQRLGGCCGLAGNWGAEKGHYDVSVAVAEHSLLPAIRSRAPDTIVLADGFSCRTQVADLTGTGSLHLAELLDPAADLIEHRRRNSR
jgi:FAD/FMN-containing dehydrogenase/Fe-S oxidoreductase